MSMNFFKSASFPGLGTFRVDIPETALYNIKATLTVSNSDDSAIQGPGGGAGTGSGSLSLPSQVTVAVKQNSSTLFTSGAGARGLDLNAVPLSAGDALNFVVASSLAKDAAPGIIRLTIAVSEGPE